MNQREKPDANQLLWERYLASIGGLGRVRDPILDGQFNIDIRDKLNIPARNGGDSTSRVNRNIGVNNRAKRTFPSQRAIQRRLMNRGVR